MNKSNTQLEAALKKLMRQASEPQVPPDAEARLLARITGAQPALFVIPLRPRGAWHQVAVALPLAASLAAGIFLGSMGVVDSLFPGTFLDHSVADLRDEGVTSGLDDAEAYLEGEQS